MMNKTIKGIATLLAVTAIGMTQTVDAMEETFIDQDQDMAIRDEFNQKNEIVKPAKVKTLKKAIKKIEEEGEWCGGFKGIKKIYKEGDAVDVEIYMGGKISRRRFANRLEVFAEYAPKGWVINIQAIGFDGDFLAGQVDNLDGKQVIAYNYIDDTITLFEK